MQFNNETHYYSLQTDSLMYAEIKILTVDDVVLILLLFLLFVSNKLLH